MTRSGTQFVRTCCFLALALTMGWVSAGRSQTLMPDLIVSDFWEQKGVIFFTLENIGKKTAAAGHTAYLSVGGHEVDTAYVAVNILPGDSYAGSFGKYRWQCSASGQFALAVRADGTNKVAESDEKNNARQEVWTCDVTPPVITQGPLVMYITQTSAKISWTTDEASDSAVRYGTQHGQYPWIKASSAQTTNHAILLNALQGGTRYYFLVESTDAAGNTVQSKEGNFLTEAEQPKLPDLIVADLWEQDHRIYARIRNQGDAAAPAGHRAGLFITDRLIDSVSISQVLAPGASTDVDFDKFYFECFDPEHTFQVTADVDDEVGEADETNNSLEKAIICDIARLGIVSGPWVQSVTTDGATIVWDTNIPGDSTVLYDNRASTFGKEQSDSQAVTKHRVILKGLAPDTVYQFKARSDAGNESVTSRAGYFRTRAKGDGQAPKIDALSFRRMGTKFPAYQMEASASDTDKVQFFADGALFYTDYSPPYEAVLAPGIAGMSYGEFFEPHPVEAVAGSGTSLARLPGLFEPPHECNEVVAEFDWPYPDEVVYIRGDTAPAGTEVPIQVHAVTWWMNCHSLGPIHVPGAEMDMVCDPQQVAVRKVSFYINGFLLGQVPSNPAHTYPITWDADGYPLGTHVIRADVVADDNCVQTITRNVRIERGDMEMDVTRRVWREANAFRIDLTVRNLGTLDYSLDVIHDNVDGLQPVTEGDSHCEISTVVSDNGEHCEVTLDLSDDGTNAVLVRAGRSFHVEYFAVPIQFSHAGTYAIGADHVEIVGPDGHDSHEFNRPCVRSEDGVRLAEEIESAIEAADYLIVTNPENCQNEFGAADAVLEEMAKLAYHRKGVLGYISNWIPSGYDPPSASAIRDQIAAWGSTMSGSTGAGSYLSDGYLLLVGETEIIRSWTPLDVSGIEWRDGGVTTQVSLSDLPYGDVSGADNVPELIVGRIIGNEVADLVQAMQSSLEGGFDRSFGVATSGMEGDWENFVGVARSTRDVWLGQAADGEIMTDDQLMHHWTAYVQKEEMVSGYDYPTDAGDGFLMVRFAGGPVALRIDPDSDTAYGTLGGDLDLIASVSHESLACPFNAGDALAAGDIDGDGEDEVVVGSMANDQIVVGYDPPHTDGGRYPSVDVTLEPWDTIVCGDVLGLGTDQVILARTAEGGTVEIYEYVSSGEARLVRTYTLSVPFGSSDGFAVGDVNATSPGEEIIVGEADGDRLYIYDHHGDPIAEIPCDPFTAYDGLVAGDLDGDGADEIAVVIDDTVDSKRRLKIFQNDCWRLDPNDEWQTRLGTASLIYSRFLQFAGVRTTGGSGADGIGCADLDGDGKEEICIAHEHDDRLYVIDGHYSAGWKDRFMPVLEEIDDQIDLFALNGHGSPRECSPFGVDDIGRLSLDSHPLVFAFSCLTGDYEGRGGDGIAEKFFDRGAGAYIGATEVSSSGENPVAATAFYDGWAPGDTPGKAFRDYRRGRASTGDNWWRYWALEYNYYGDPKLGAADTAVEALSEEIVHADIRIAAVTLPGPNEAVAVPQYEVKQEDRRDHVTIPGGDVLLESGQPIVPYYKAQWELPAGTVVQNVQLRRRGGLKTDIGLVLPIAVRRQDANGVGPEPSPDPGWYPKKDLDWRLVPNSDGSTSLVVFLYPFFYNSFTTEVRFYQDYVIDVETVSSQTQIVSLSADKPSYQVGDTVTINLLLNGIGKAADIFVDVTIRRYGSDDLAEGLLLRCLGGLSGPASFSPTWDSRGALPGTFYADVTIVDVTGKIRDRAKCMFELVAAPQR